MRKRVTSIATKYKLIQQRHLTSKDVMDLCECGNTTAARIRQEIEAKIAPSTLPDRVIPTRLVVEHQDIDLAYIVQLYRLTAEGGKA